MSNRKSSLELLDETFHWLRQLPAETWLIYGACAAPFYLLALRAFQDLRTGGTEAIEPASLTAMAVAYLLYGFGRSEFLRRFDGEIRREPATRSGGFPAIVNHLLLHTAELALL